jgi:hypothetical protein
MTFNNTNQGAPMNDLPTWKENALGNAVAAAEAACQATWVLWEQMTPAERDAWLELQEVCWPRLDIYLHRLLPIANQIVADEQAAEA